MTNIDRSAALRAVLDLHPKSPGQRWVGFPRADCQEHYCMADQQAWPCDTIRALAEVGWLAPAPQIIRTMKEMEGMDPDTVVLGGDGFICLVRQWLAGDEVDREIHQRYLPGVVIAPADQVRAAQKAMEEA